MVRNYKAKGKRRSWTSADIPAALRQLEHGVSIRQVSDRTGIPKSTLHDIKTQKYKHERRRGQCHPGKYTVLSPDQERELSHYARELCASFFGMTSLEIRRLAYDFVEKNNIEHPFNSTTKMAGKDWFRGFLKRNPDISLRKPEATSMARATGFNKTAVKRFYENLSKAIDEKIDGTRIYNVDESGLSTVPIASSAENLK